ncbi:hypothetical protein [Leptospira interrogans]|uniref:hypothetical protein n=1 Tax=Leptospira interrogans TaxID=173 RepID=UPI001912BD23|nr:hypothetical protein [Leptospira interrogans]
MATARIANSRQSRIQPSGAGLLVDLAGENPLNYGDGAGDGFTDHFITPPPQSGYRSMPNGSL